MKKTQSRWSRILLTITLAALTAVCVLIITATGVHLWQSFTIKDAETIAAIRANFSQELVFSLLGIAISVWIGLNIYNVLSKEDLQALKEKTEETAEKVTKDAYTEVLISKLRLMPADRIENYLATRLSVINRLPCSMLVRMIELEDKFNYAYSMYVAGQYTKVVVQGLTLTAEIDSMYTQNGELNTELDAEQKAFLAGYIALRKGDFSFFADQYRNKPTPHREKLVQNILDAYKTALLNFFHTSDISFCFDKAAYEAEECQAIALLANNICSTYLVLMPRKLTQDELKKAIEAGEKAIEFATEVQPHIKSIFMRNLGAAYERNGNWELAIQNYYKAYELDPTDPKILHCIASWYRKQLGQIISQEKIGKARKKQLLECSTYWYWMELIQRGGNMAESAWPTDLQNYAKDLGGKALQEQTLRDILLLGQKCHEELEKISSNEA